MSAEESTDDNDQDSSFENLCNISIILINIPLDLSQYQYFPHQNTYNS